MSSDGTTSGADAIQTLDPQSYLSQPLQGRATQAAELHNATALRVEQNPLWQDVGFPDDVIASHREALALCPANDPHRLTYLVNFIGMLCQPSGQPRSPDDVDEAVSLHWEALRLIPSFDGLRFGLISCFINLTRARYLQRGQREDVDHALLLHQEAINELPHLDSRRVSFLKALDFLLQL